MGITPSRFCPNFLPHSFSHWWEDPTLRTHKASQVTRIPKLPLSKAHFHQHQQHQKHKKPSKPQEVWAYSEENDIVTMGRTSGGTTCSTGEDIQREDACLGNPLLVFMAGQCEVFPFLSLFDFPFLQHKIIVTLRNNIISYRSANKFCMWELVSTLCMQYQDLQDLPAQLLSSQSLFSPCDTWVLSPQVQNSAFADHQLVYLSSFF